MSRTKQASRKQPKTVKASNPDQLTKKTGDNKDHGLKNVSSEDLDILKIDLSLKLDMWKTLRDWQNLTSGWICY